MGDRPTKKLRRLSTDEDIKVSPNQEAKTDSVAPTPRDGAHGRPTQAPPQQLADSSTMPRAPRRPAAAPPPPAPTTATVKHSQAPPTGGNPGQRSIRLTVKAPPSKLREVITAGASETSRQTLSRSSKNKKTIVEASSDEDDDDVEMKDVGDDDEDEEDAESDEDEEDDEDEQQHATISVRGAQKPPILRVTAPQSTRLRNPSPDRVLKIPPKVESVEGKEARLDTGRGGGGKAINQPASDDEELSDLGSEEEEEEDGEGEEEEDEDGQDEDDDAMELEEEDAASESSADDSELPPLSAIQAAAQNLPGRDSDSDNLSSGDEHGTSRAETPDPTKLTRRQRQTSPTSLLALSNEATKKKHFTAEQITMRRAEMARRRKDLSEKRAQEEKADTLRRLLEKPTGPKRRSRAQVLADLEREEFGLERPGVVYGTPGEDGESGEVEERFVKAKPGWCRTVVRAEGTKVGVPEEWLEGPVGRVFEGVQGVVAEKKGWKVISGSRMVQVVE